LPGRDCLSPYRAAQDLCAVKGKKAVSRFLPLEVDPEIAAASVRFQPLTIYIYIYSVYLYIIYIYYVFLYIHIYIYLHTYAPTIPVVPHKAVAEVSKIGNYRRSELL